MGSLQVINDEALRYLRTETTMASLNDNLAPTVFIDDNEEDPKLYIFYTNVTDVAQDFYLDPGDIVEIFYATGYEAIFSNDISGLVLDADRLYSTAGTNRLFDINSDYDVCTTATMNENIFELSGLETIAPNLTCPGPFTTASPNGVCVRLPAVSMGYFVVPFEISLLREGLNNDLLAIYPNPSSTHFYIRSKNLSESVSEQMEIEVLDMVGKTVLTLHEVLEGQAIDVSTLPVGTYSVIIKCNGRQENELFIKMK